MHSRSQDTPITVVNRFEVKGDAEGFEREFRDHSQYLRTREGFDFLVTVQLVERPDVYVHLGHWRTMRGFLDTVHDDTFQAHVKKLGPLVNTEVDQAVSVGRVLKENAVVGARNVVLTQARTFGATSSSFEQLFAETSEHFARLGGFGGSDLLRSTLRPDTYTGIQWWRDTEDCERALADRGHRAQAGQMRRTADVEVLRTRHVAYERVVV
ncbi:antibiotic biosynthesis monooxygenase [Streptomyces sp. NPDC005356]|uniref:antibiotic biosynthesis monooxygenase family protein n=1 Tax=unclassified Streptomyces TaxID=2593676 RepID=UPI0033A7A1CA